MNLHVTNDRYGIYPVHIAHRIKESDNANNNRIVNLYPTSIFQDEIIAYINISKKDFKEYINALPKVEKVIFHSYTLTAYNFLIILLKKFPDVKVYWMFWSYEMYNLPHQVHK